MQKKSDIMNVDIIVDERFGKVGTPESNAFRKGSYAPCIGQIIRDERKREKIMQLNFAQGMAPTNRICRVSRMAALSLVLACSSEYSLPSVCNLMYRSR